ncbi:unnamed protein product [Amaranthus hypochondriacus]
MGSEEEEEERIDETFFISHGSPRLTEDKSHPLNTFFGSWREKVISKKPKAILAISAHWSTDEPCVTGAHVNDTISYDFHDITYSPHLYQLKYPAPGSPDLAKRVKEVLLEAGLRCVHIDKERGLDHATWVPLMLMYPEADIPVCQLSIQPHLDGTHHFNLGRALAPLKDEGVLILGTGSATHPLWDTPQFKHGVAPWAAHFDSWLQTTLLNGRYEELITYTKNAPNWRIAHPTPEHIYPLHVAMGAAGESSKAEIIHSSWYYGLLSNGTIKQGAYKFTST